MAVIKVEPWGEDQGDFVVIDEKDFDPKKHTLYDPDKKHDDKPHKKPARKNESR